MRRITALVAATLVAVTLCLFAACSSDGSDKPDSTVPSTVPSTTVVPVTSQSTTSTAPTVTTTTVACQPRGSTDTVTTSASASAALLRAVQVKPEQCADRVTFDFTLDNAVAPKCTIAYDDPPFTMDGSGAPVTIAGSAFVRVRCEPAYGYDFETGNPTYTGPKRITATGTRHVRELAQTGDFEGVLNWVIGLDAEQPFTVATAAVSGSQGRTRVTIRFF